ncbi:hypothetical protein [Janibacter terrae]|jgi:hypothetical protein|uniref:hypothetical protein n=1 Tax=Janibacter terrae TaxID=103817 RepID=UPI000830E50B|nr:hypothetical protein [Janibacter terrae]
MACEESQLRLMDAARVRSVREELDGVLRRGIDAPHFGGVEAVERYLRSGRVDEAREAMGRLQERSR